MNIIGLRKEMQSRNTYSLELLNHSINFGDIDIEVKNEDRMTLLGICAFKGDFETLKFLINYGANIRV